MKAAHTNTHKRAGVLSLTATALLLSNFIFPTWADTPNKTTPEEITSIQLQSDGSITAVKNADQELDPNQVATQLPVIVITSYTHNGKTVSDPTQFQGVKGSIRIDVSIQNQTGKLETLNANINGQQRSKQKLIYTPLSVAASVTLDDTKPSQIKKPTADNRALATNGIVGTTTNGHPSIQWAEINGINSKHTSKFTLVYETEDFKPPVFNIVVQPGFGINFDIAQQKAESALIVETLQIFNDAEKVLDDSGEALGKARTILKEAGSQIGSKTINDLEASNRRVADNAKRVAATLNDVETQATRRFKETGSNNLRQLLETTAVVRSLLGDPNSNTPKLQIDPTTCALTETPAPHTPNAETNPEKIEIPSVMQVIHGLSARLNVLSEASESCKNQLLNDVDNFIGPQDPNETSCVNQNSLSCIDWRYRQNLKTYWENRDTKNAEVLKALNSTADTTPKNSLKTLGTGLERVQNTATTLNEARSLADVEQKLNELKQGIDEEIKTITDLAIKLQKTTAETQQLINADKQPEQIKTLLKEICLSKPATPEAVPAPLPIVPAPTPGGTPAVPTPGATPVVPGPGLIPLQPALPTSEIKVEKANELAKLIWGKDCPANEAELDNGLNEATPDSLYGVNQAQATTLNEKLLSFDAATDSIYTTLQTHLQQLTELKTNAETLSGALETAKNKADNAQTQLDEAIKEAKESFKAITREVDQLNVNLKSFKTELEKHLDDAKTSMNALTEENQQQVKDGVNGTRTKFETATKQLFTKFSEELQKEAKDLTGDGRLVINHTLGRLDEANWQQTERIATQTAQDIENIQNVTANGVKETDVVSQLLSEDIKRVLFDIGTNENRGTGLLGAVATSNAHLTLADTKMVDSTKQLELSKNNHRAAQADEIFADVALRATVARLENTQHFPQQTGNQPSLGWFTFHVAPTRNN